MPEQPREQGPQAIVLRSLLLGGYLPGVQYGTGLADHALASRPDGTVRVLTEGLEPETEITLAELAQAVDPGVVLLDTEQARAELTDPAAGVVRSQVTSTGGESVRVVVEVCGLHDGTWRAFESFTVEMVRGPQGWTVHGDPLHLAT